MHHCSPPLLRPALPVLAAHLVHLLRPQRSQQQQQPLVRAVRHAAPRHLIQQQLRCGAADVLRHHQRFIASSRASRIFAALQRRRQLIQADESKRDGRVSMT